MAGRWNQVRYRQGRYSASMDRLLEHLDDAVGVLAVLDATPGRLAAHHAKMKRAVITKLKNAIRAKTAWHHGEIAKADAAGLGATVEHQPQSRSISTGRMGASTS
jgi:hypothetical protein